jgi:hypothetical protein
MTTHCTRPAVRRAAAICAVGALIGPAAALGAPGGFHATVPFSSGRSSHLHVGEPLEFSDAGQKITSVCWSPAPIQHARCGTDFAAPALPGQQHLTVMLANGTTLHRTLTIDPRATRLPKSPAEAAAADARVVEFKATCSADAYQGFHGAHLTGHEAAQDVKRGEFLAAYYRQGADAILAMPYHHPLPSFYHRNCLKRVL